MTAFEKEAKEKWGQSPAYQEYESKHLSGQNQNDLAAGMDRIMAAFALCMKSGAAPDSVQAQKLVKALQDYITENCYHCTNEILAGLGRMYVADERFKANIDQHADGTAAFIRDAVTIFCRQ